MGRPSPNLALRQAHRTVHRQVLVAKLQRSLKRGLRPDQVRDLAMAHNVNLDALRAGDADPMILWEWVGGMLTWSRAAELMGLGVPEMTAQLELGGRVAERYAETGRLHLEADEYDLARTGVLVMDTLAEQVPRNVAKAAADWAEPRVNEMARKAAEAMQARQAAGD